MATIRNFEDLEIWKNSGIITRDVYADFVKNKDFSFKDQIQRASVSIMNNISEGFSRQTDKEKKNFLNFAKGSANEVKNMYYIAEDLQSLTLDVCAQRRDSLQGLINGLAVFMKYLAE